MFSQRLLPRQAFCIPRNNVQINIVRFKSNKSNKSNTKKFNSAIEKFNSLDNKVNSLYSKVNLLDKKVNLLGKNVNSLENLDDTVVLENSLDTCKCTTQKPDNKDNSLDSKVDMIRKHITEEFGLLYNKIDKEINRADDYKTLVKLLQVLLE